MRGGHNLIVVLLACQFRSDQAVFLLRKAWGTSLKVDEPAGVAEGPTGPRLDRKKCAASRTAVNVGNWRLLVGHRLPDRTQAGRRAADLTRRNICTSISSVRVSGSEAPRGVLESFRHDRGA